MSMSFLKTHAVLAEVGFERERQDKKWGEQNHPNGTGNPKYRELANEVRAKTDARMKDGSVTYRDIMSEELAEAYAESDPKLLRRELVQVAAVAVAWIEKIDRDERKAVN